MLDVGRSLVDCVRECLPNGPAENRSIRSVQLSRLWIEIGHDPVAVDPDNRIGRHVQDLTQPLRDSVFLSFVSPLLFGIAKHQNNAVQFSVVIDDGGATVVNGRALSVPRYENGMVSKTDNR